MVGYMDIEKELKMPFDYSWNIVIIMLEIIVIIILGYIFYKYFWQILKNYIIKPDVPHLRDRYVKKLTKLYKDVENKKIDLRDAYLKLSKLIREFIEGTTGINVLTLSKSEVKKLGIKELSLLMEEYYPPEFSKYSEGNILNSIDRTLKVMKMWE